MKSDPIKSDPIVSRLISEEWPNLKKRAENEIDVEKLIAVVIEIDEFLLRLETRVATNDKEMLSAGAESKPDCRAVPDIRLGNSGIGSA
jgi:hypothetical protein